MPTVHEHYRAGSGSPLVLLHGATTSWTVWTPILDNLARHHEVFAVTMPGHRGGPPLPIGHRTVQVAAFVDGVEQQLDELGLTTAHLVGNSLGGRVSLELLRRGRARSVTAISPACAEATPADGDRVYRLFRTMLWVSRVPGPGYLARRSPRARRALSRLAMENGDRLTPDQVARNFADWRTARPWLLALGRNARAEGDIAPLDPGLVPVCVAWGTHDRILPFDRHGAPLLDLVPGARIVRLPRCGHVPMWDDPDLVTDVILRTAAEADKTQP